MHICFGYAAIIHERPSGYSFLPELEGADVRQISIETAQSHLDCNVLAALPSKTILLGVLDLSDMNVEKPAIVAERIRRALPYVGANRIVVAPDCGLSTCRVISRSRRCGQWWRVHSSCAGNSVEANGPHINNFRLGGQSRYRTNVSIIRA